MRKAGAPVPLARAGSTLFRDRRERGGGLAGLSLDRVVERVELAGDGAEPLRCELEAFVRAVRGEAATVVSGHDGRRALAVALEIMQRIEHHVAGWQTA